MTAKTVFPFAAVVGQDQIKKALLIAVVNPKVGGVLIAGEKGSAKSTLVRGLSQVIPNRKLIELPLNATEDMVFGSMDMEQAIITGKRQFSHGILAKAHNHILYIDEVNLLQRELSNAILDVAVSGIHVVEREGVSNSYEAQFTMIGTMNPEEGDLPPQFLDRFGLYVTVAGEKNIKDRVEILRRILAYEQNPIAFYQKYKRAGEDICQQIAAARKKVKQILISDAMMQLAAQISSQGNCAGHRAEIFLLETAKAIASLAGRHDLLPMDMQEAAAFVLPHRMRQPPEESREQHSQKKQQHDQPAQDSFNKEQSQLPDEEQSNANEPSQDRDEAPEVKSEGELEKGKRQEDTTMADLLPIGNMALDLQKRQVRQSSGKRTLAKTNTRQGRYVRSCIPTKPVTDLAFDATLRAAAPYQLTRAKSMCCINICRGDLRQKVREKRIGSTFLFVVDASGSMGARQRMKAVKGAILSMLQDAYQKRDKVGMIAFRRQTAEILLPVTRSVELAEKSLQHLPTGGKTPLAEGLYTALGMLSTMCRLEKGIEPVMVLVTDGRANAGGRAGQDAVSEALQAARLIGETGVNSLVIDTEQDFIKLGIAFTIAHALGGSYYKLDDLSAENIIHIVNGMK
ncbi:protoporphyrin IX magnesium-chelatase [Pelosinus fermentans]|uniref:ATPase associated with various cellular activities AAA_5 n=1 Tax=Pelosinus fermentans B4 TaxID=1149862 RepID=I9B1R4_9FIRM|nr:MULTISPECIES: magnesium chelatase subunit D family protein [Pelosinus]EIW19092.1 ATPase associated with various cellular activities AAA_5 [Pelosinus fermentans B4]OAM95454.1 Magnesium chelatase [Pelosinus fermentans DSM 17108]SDR28261.1 protoporphyrin IX magnesium-chelatase [Pelosinus fermentans]